MSNPTQALIDLETKFWQSMVNQDTDAALAMLCEPAVMVSARGALKFDRESYRKMAEQGSMVLTGFEFSDMQVVFPNAATAVLTYRVKQEVAQRDKDERVTQEMNDSSTWVKQGKQWQCVMHTETPAAAAQTSH
jgi:ketosteroid isomerase-like protein